MYTIVIHLIVKLCDCQLFYNPLVPGLQKLTGRAGHFWYFLMFSTTKNYLFAVLSS